MKNQLLIAGIAAVLCFGLQNCKDTKGCKNKTSNTQTNQTTLTKAETTTITSIEDTNALYNFKSEYLGKNVKGFEYLGEYTKKSLKDGSHIIVLSKGIESQLIDFIESDKAIDKNTWFNFRGILFKTASSELDERSNSQLENVSKILKAYPNVELKLGGYTDNTGNAKYNKKLSGERANALLNALITKGTKKNRLKAEGYGIEHPIADNNTEAGRSLNRRVSARVTKK